MEHQEALQLKAAERYLLGELNGDLREQFEAHYFSCAECARDVQTGAAFIDGAREVFGEGTAPEPAAEQPRTQSPRWFDFLLRPAFAAPAFAALLLVVAFQNAVTIPQMKRAISDAKQSRVLPYFPLSAASRGGEALEVPYNPNGSFGLFFDIPPEKKFPAYTCVVESESGNPEESLNVSPQQDSSSVLVELSMSRLGPGKHRVVVRGARAVDGSDGQQAVVISSELTLVAPK